MRLGICSYTRFCKIVSSYPSLFNDTIFLNRNKDDSVPSVHVWKTVAFMRPLRGIFVCYSVLLDFHFTTIFARSNTGIVGSNPS
jgi:hypothetical protein